MKLSQFVRTVALGGTLALAMAPAAALADNDDTWMPGWGRMMDMWGPGGMMGGYGSGWMLDRMDGRLAYMKTELKITADQEAAWNDFSAAVRTAAQAHNDLMKQAWSDGDDGKFRDQPLPDRLSWQVSHLEARLDQVKALKAATDTFYAALTDEQKKAADDVVLPTMGMGAGRRGPGWMHW